MSAPPQADEFDVLVARSRRLLVQALSDTARPAAHAAATYVTDKAVGLGVGLTLTLAAVILLVTGVVMLLSQYIPLWATCCGVGAVALPTGLFMLSRARR